MIEYLGGKIETEFENVLACYWFKSLKNMKVENLVTLPLKLKIKRYGIGFLKKKNTRYKRNNGNYAYHRSWACQGVILDFDLVTFII